MTLTTGPAPAGGTSGAANRGAEVAPADLVTVTIDGIEVSVPKGTLVIRAAELLGIAIPRFCDHPLLEPAGACRQCLVEIGTPDREGVLRFMPKPQASCTITVSPGMVVKTQQSSPVADKAQHGVMELLLLNHPLDCPVCDKGGECPLQNQAMSNGRGETRFVDTKRTFPKPLKISTQVLLDRERCILCQRCTRFSQEIAGDPFIDLQNRGAMQQIGTFAPDVLDFAGGPHAPEPLDSDGPTPAPAVGVTDGPEGAAGLMGDRPEGAAETDESGNPFSSYYSGNTIQICPVGALTGAAYRFRARPFDLVSSPTTCEHCASGCAIRADHRRGTVLRRLAGDDPAVNEEWNCDKGRWGFQYAQLADRLTVPMVRDAATGELVETSWPDAMAVAAAGLAAAKAGPGVGVLVGGRSTVEDAYAYSKFARVALDTNNIDFRARPHSTDEEAFLGRAVAGTGIGVTYADLEKAPAVLLVALDPEEESPIVQLRLRKAWRKHGQRLFDVAPFATSGSRKAGGTLLATVPGDETAVLRALAGESPAPLSVSPAAADAARGALVAGSVILVGERLAMVPGALHAAVELARVTGARLAWVPRRAGDRGAVEAGVLPSLLPGGRPVEDPAARVDAAATWGVETLPSLPGRDTTGILSAAVAGAALVVGGVDPADLPDPALAERALAAASFVVSLEIRASAVHPHADVVLPVAPVAEKSGAFLDWEGRLRPFEPSLATDALPDHAILDELAREMGVDLGLADTLAVRAELASFGSWDGARVVGPAWSPRAATGPREGVVLATWPLLLDRGRMQDGEPHLAGTAHRAVARMSAATAQQAGVAPDGHVRVTGVRGSVELPVAVTAMPDGVVWLPTNSRGSEVRAGLGSAAGDLVSLSPVARPVASVGHQQGGA